ncbi:nickel ABC transporter substrate-binding protein [Bacillus sp. FJAT-44742]|uniref:nickel ABC transporter substrate-binding protein n=1 Tax=Bacillus sp. FJAT-44742 TaxID=2014005 RepID=UPI000C24D088|nr:nickel ABC transporter substrate-binding protein [Bacillus sp. FJAT-44742]
MKKTASILFPALLFLTACAENQSSESEVPNEEREENTDKSLTLLFSFGSDTLDPHLSWVPVRAGVTETLVKVNEDLELEPWLAESWEQVDDQTWEFEIKENIPFHNGELLTAQVAAESLERSIEVNPSLEVALKIEEIQAEGQTLVIHTTEPHPMLTSELVNADSGITLTENEDITERPYGTGPFQVSDFEPNSAVHLTRFDDYWDGAANVEEATFTFNNDANVRGMALQSKEADISYHIPPESLDPIENDEDLSIHSVPSVRTHYLVYQFDNPLLQDQNVRKAIDLLFDRESIVNDIMGGHADPASGPFHPSFSFGSESEAKHSLEEAETLLKEDGWEKNEEGLLMKDGEVLDFTLVTYQARPELPLIAQVLQGEASKIGINMDIRMVENIDAYLHENEDWDLATYSVFSAPRGDGGYFLNVSKMPNGALNPGNTDHKELNEVIETLNQEPNMEKRTELVKEATSVIQENNLQSYIIYPYIVVGVNNRVKNWEPGSEEFYILTNELDVE